MARGSKSVETLKHADARRMNIPTAEYESVMDDAIKSPIRIAYERRNRDLDPQLVWRGKDEQDWSDLVVARAAALHPGEGASQGADRRPAAPEQARGEAAEDRPTA